MSESQLYYMGLIGILFYKNKVIGYTNSIAEGFLPGEALCIAKQADVCCL